jgi:hypothetical protein
MLPTVKLCSSIIYSFKLEAYEMSTYPAGRTTLPSPADLIPDNECMGPEKDLRHRHGI